MNKYDEVNSEGKPGNTMSQASEHLRPRGELLAEQPTVDTSRLAKGGSDYRRPQQTK